MKRSELKVGMEVAIKPKSYEGHVKMVFVIAVEPWTASRSRWNDDKFYPVHSNKGVGVAVAKPGWTPGEWVPDVMSLGQLVTVETAEKFFVDQNVRQAASDEYRKQQAATWTAINKKLVAAGVPHAFESSSPAVLGEEAFEWILDRLEALSN